MPVARRAPAVSPLIAVLVFSASCSRGGQTYDDGTGGVGKNNAAAPTVEERQDASATEQPEAPGASASASSCAELTSQIAAAAQTIYADVNRQCQTDANCTEVSYKPQCMDSCGSQTSVAVSGVAAVEAAVDELNASLCADFDSAGCVFFPSGCPYSPLVLACVNQRCEFVPESSASPEETTGSGPAPDLDAGSSNGTSPDARSPDAGANESTEEPVVILPPNGPDCFGPEHFPEAAVEGVRGCDCQDVGGACIGDTGIVCSQNDGTLGQWTVVKDGPCDPFFVLEPCEGLLNSADACVRYFGICTESGSALCGHEARSQLCPDGLLVDSSDNCVMGRTCVPLDDGLFCSAPLEPIDAGL